MEKNQKVTPDEILESRIIKKFLGRYGKNQSGSTHRNYRTALKQFFKFIDKNPDAYIQDVRLLENGDKIRQMTIYENDIEEFWLHIKKTDAPKTIHVKLSAIKSVLRKNRIELDQVFWDDINNLSTNVKVTRDMEPTKEIIQQVLNQGDVKSRALFLAQLSSGMRIGELCSLKFEDIDFSKERPMVTVRYSSNDSKTQKNKQEPRTTFFSREAHEVIKEWMKIRQDYLDRVSKSTNFSRTLPDGTVIKATKSSQDDRLFPFTTATARIRMLQPMLKRAKLAELNKNSDRFKFRTTSFRQYFKKHMCKYDQLIANQLTGHSGYMSMYTEIKDNDTLLKHYLEGEKYLLVYTTETESSAQQLEINELKQQVDSLTQNNFDMKDLFAKQLEEIEGKYQNKYNEILEKLK